MKVESKTVKVQNVTSSGQKINREIQLMQYKARAVKHLHCYSRATANEKDSYVKT